MKIFKRALILITLLVIFIISIFILIQLSSNSLQVNDPKISAPTNGHFITVGDEQIFIQESGTRQKVAYFFIHGTGSWSELWKPTMKELNDKGYYSVAIDLEPFGYSYSKTRDDNLYNRNFQAKKLLSIIKQLGIEKVILVGHSFGGRATLTLALMAPEKIEKLILINIALGFGNDATSPPAPLPLFAHAIINNNFLRNIIASIGSMPFLTKKLVSSFVADEKSISKEVELMYQRPLSLKGKNQQISDWLKAFLLISDNGLLLNRNELKNLTMPVSIIWGDLDTVTPLWQAHEIQKLFKNSKFNSIREVGHIPMIENPSAFKELFFQ